MFKRKDWAMLGVVVMGQLGLVLCYWGIQPQFNSIEMASAFVESPQPAKSAQSPPATATKPSSSKPAVVADANDVLAPEIPQELIPASFQTAEPLPPKLPAPPTSENDSVASIPDIPPLPVKNTEPSVPPVPPIGIAPDIKTPSDNIPTNNPPPLNVIASPPPVSLPTKPAPVDLPPPEPVSPDVPKVEDQETPVAVLVTPFPGVKAPRPSPTPPGPAAVESDEPPVVAPIESPIAKSPSPPPAPVAASEPESASVPPPSPSPIGPAPEVTPAVKPLAPSSPPKLPIPVEAPISLTPKSEKLCKWKLRVQIVGKRTQLTATTVGGAEFLIRCQKLNLSRPSGNIEASGDVQIEGKDFSGRCDALTISWSEDRIFMTGNAQMKSLRTSDWIELNGPQLHLRLSNVQPGKKTISDRATSSR